MKRPTSMTADDKKTFHITLGRLQAVADAARYPERDTLLAICTGFSDAFESIENREKYIDHLESQLAVYKELLGDKSA